MTVTVACHYQFILEKFLYQYVVNYLAINNRFKRDPLPCRLNFCLQFGDFGD